MSVHAQYIFGTTLFVPSCTSHTIHPFIIKMERNTYNNILYLYLAQSIFTEYQDTYPKNVIQVIMQAKSFTITRKKKNC